MLCGEEIKVNGQAWSGAAISLRCKCWHCQYCAEINKVSVIGRAKAGRPDTFITLTVNPRWGGSPDERARALVESWRKIRRKVEEQLGKERIPFMAVFEATKKGEPHLHILCRLKWLDQKWLSGQMKEMMDAPIVDIRRIKDRDQASRYVAKYVGKACHKFEGTKRYWTSRDFQLEADNDNGVPVIERGYWIQCNRSIISLRDQLEAEGTWNTHFTGGRLIWWHKENFSPPAAASPS